MLIKALENEIIFIKNFLIDEQQCLTAGFLHYRTVSKVLLLKESQILQHLSSISNLIQCRHLKHKYL